MEKQHFSCNCQGNCCQLECPCFKRGGVCGIDCKCINCENKSTTSLIRLESIEKILNKNPQAFTPLDGLNEDELSSITNFALISNSIDSEPFQIIPKITPLSKLLAPEVIDQAIKTVISAASQDLSNSNNTNYEENLENSVSFEFERVLNTVLEAVLSKK